MPRRLLEPFQPAARVREALGHIKIHSECLGLSLAKLICDHQVTLLLHFEPQVLSLFHAWLLGGTLARRSCRI
jgi:hypothetical protein